MCLIVGSRVDLLTDRLCSCALDGTSLARSARVKITSPGTGDLDAIPLYRQTINIRVGQTFPGLKAKPRLKRVQNECHQIPAPILDRH